VTIKLEGENATSAWARFLSCLFALFLRLGWCAWDRPPMRVSMPSCSRP